MYVQRTCDLPNFLHSPHVTCLPSLAYALDYFAHSLMVAVIRDYWQSKTQSANLIA